MNLGGTVQENSKQDRLILRCLWHPVFYFILQCPHHTNSIRKKIHNRVVLSIAKLLGSQHISTLVGLSKFIHFALFYVTIKYITLIWFKFYFNFFIYFSNGGHISLHSPVPTLYKFNKEKIHKGVSYFLSPCSF